MTGEELRILRVDAGLTQEQLAVMLDHSGTTIRNWENNRIAIPHIKTHGIKFAIQKYKETGQIAA